MRSAFSGTLIPSLTAEQLEYLSAELSPEESEPCQCFSCFKWKKRDRKKFTVRRMPGKVAHLVPMQRFDSALLKRPLSTAKPSNLDFQSTSASKFPPITDLETKSSLEDSLIVAWSPGAAAPGFSSSSHRPLDTSTSISSFKAARVTQYEPNTVQSQLEFRFTSPRLHIKRSSV